MANDDHTQADRPAESLIGSRHTNTPADSLDRTLLS